MRDLRVGTLPRQQTPVGNLYPAMRDPYPAVAMTIPSTWASAAARGITGLKLVRNPRLSGAFLAALKPNSFLSDCGAGTEIALSIHSDQVIPPTKLF